MGFLSFHEKYYTESLKRLEGRTLDESELYEAKQLLKILDDLLDEGYTRLSCVLEEKYRAVSRLKAILSVHREVPFPVGKSILPGSDAVYGDTEMEIEAVCRKLADCANSGAAPSDNPLLADLRAYCDWIGRQPDTAYVFLLRDAFLPYLYAKSGGEGGLYPWVVNRDFLRQIAGRDADDELRLPVYEALENGVSDFRDFSEFCKTRIRDVLGGCPSLERTLRELLGEIREEKILVIESGYCGTVPLTLSALDDRVDFRLYTTAPYLFDVYRDKIFCKKYEQIRSFETLYAQETLMKYSSYRNKKFYVRTAVQNPIWEKAAGEMIALQSGG